MICRRAFCCSAVAATASPLFPNAAFSQDTDFVCSAVDRLPGQGDQFSLQNMANSMPAKNVAFETTIKTFGITPYGVSFYGDRWLRSDGNTPGQSIITLGIYFLDGTDQQRRGFQDAVGHWLEGDLGKLIRFDYSVPRNRSQIRVSFAPTEGNYSYVGRNNLRISLSQKTMNIADPVDRIMMHEMGHALGLQHEHMHAAAEIVWNEQVVIEEMARLGWSEQMTRTNIIERYASAAVCVGSPAFDRQSVMLYPIPKRWTRNGFSSGENMVLSTGDRNCARGLYST